MTDRAVAGPRVAPVAVDLWDDETRALLGADVPGGRPGATSGYLATLAHDPSLLRLLMRSVRRLLVKSSLPGRDRELVVLRTAWRCQTAYSWGEHVRLAHAEGLTAADVERVVAGPDAGWGAHEAALLRAVDEIHDAATISDPTWATLAARYDDVALVELPMLVGLYHTVSWTQNAVGIQPDPGRPGLESR